MYSAIEEVWHLRCTMSCFSFVAYSSKSLQSTTKPERWFGIDNRITSPFCELVIWRVTHDLLTHMWRWACPGPFSSFLYHHIWVLWYSSASFHISSLPGAFLNVLRARQGTKLHEVKMYSAQKSSFGMGKKEVGMSCDRAHMAYRTHSRHIGGTQKVYQHAAWHTL